MSDERQDIIQQWIESARENRGTPGFVVSRAAFRALLDGDPPYQTVIGAVTGLTTQAVHDVVRQLVSEGRLTVDAATGAVTGAGGLSLVESRHVMSMNGRRYWGWCALDAVGIPAALGLNAEVRSACADTGEPVRVEIRRGERHSVEPAGVVIALWPPARQNLMADSCARMDFHVDPGRIPGRGVALGIDEAMALGRELWRDGVPL
jgi:hypothetical protein